MLLPIFFGSIGYSIPFIPLWKGENIWRGFIYAILMTLVKAFCGAWLLIWKIPGSQGTFIGGMRDRARDSRKGALLLGFAMIARGEIGLLISQIAYSTPEPLLDDDEFLITIWAIVICTIIGPAVVGYFVKKWGKTVVDGGWD